MTLEIFLARRLLEAVVDPDAPRALAEEAGAELAEIVSARQGRALVRCRSATLTVSSQTISRP